MKLFVFIGSLLVLALVAALVVPPFVDWNQFRDRFEREASRIAGQEVRVLGSTSARLLPLPSVTFNDIRVGPQEQPILTASRFNLDMELAPLLRGEVVIVDIALDAPRFDLRLGADGKPALPPVNSEFPADVAARDVALDRFSITDGIVRLRDEGDGREIILRDMDLAGSARTLAGPWRADGTLVWRDQRFRIDGSTGVWRGEETPADARNLITVRGTVQPQNLAYDVALNGAFGMVNGLPQWDGTVNIAPASSQTGADRIAFQRVDPASAVNARLEGGLRLAASGAIMPVYRLEVGDVADPYVVTGSAFANFKDDTSFEINAEGQQIDLSRLPGADDAPKTLAARLETLTALVSAIPRPNSPGTINLDLPAVVADGTVIRGVALSAQPRANGWQIGELRAELPGRTDVLAKGFLGVAEALSYEGELTLASRQPSGLASWLADDVPPPIRALQNAGFSGDVVLGNGVTRADNVEIILDDKRLEGLLAETGRASGAPTLQIELSGEAIDLDALSAIGRLLSQDTTDTPRDLAFAIRTDALKVRSFEAGDVTARGSLKSGRLDFETLSIGDLRGAEITASGPVAVAENGLDGRLEGRIVATDIAGLVDLIRPQLSAYPQLGHLLDDPQLLGDLTLDYVVSTNDTVSTLSLNGEAGGTTIEAELLAEDRGALMDRPLRATIGLSNPRSETLLAQLGFDAGPLLEEEKAILSISFNGVPSDALQLSAGGFIAGLSGAAQGNLTVVPGGRLTGTSDIDLRSTNLDLLTLVSGIALPGFGEGLTGDLRAALTIEPDRVRADRITLRYDETTLKGDLAIARPANGLRPRVTGTLATESLDADLLAALVWGPDVEAQSGAALSARPLTGIDGRVSLQVGRLLTAPNLPALDGVTADLTLSDGDFQFSAIKAQVSGALLTGEVDLSRSGANLLVAGQVASENLDLATVANVLGIASPIRGTGSLEGFFNATAPGRPGLLANLTGGGRFVPRALSLEGFNGAAFGNILALGEAATGTAVALDRAALAQAGILSGATALQPTPIPYSVTNGTLRIDDVALASGSMTASADLRLPLDGADVEGALDVTFEAGRDALAGLSPSLRLAFSGPRSAPGLTVETTALNTYLGQRNAQARERAFLNEQAAILDRQRLARDLRALQLEEARARRLQEEQETRRLELERRQQERLPDPASGTVTDPLRDLSDRVLRQLSPNR